MKNLILIRHGESIWNLENRFTGWFDVELTPKGKEEAETAGKLIKNLNIEINKYQKNSGIIKPFQIIPYN